MLLPRFDFHEPATLAEACRTMASLGEAARPIAGGTDLLVNIKKKVLAPKHLVSLARIDALHDIQSLNGHLVIGACMTVSELAESAAIQDRLGALRAGARSLGTPLIRNLATIGGNIGSARPAADLPPSLMVYGTTLVLTGSQGRREMPIGDFFKGPGMTALAPSEIISEIRVDLPGPLSGAGYINIGVRKSQDCNIVNVAAFITLDAPEGAITEARIAMGCVGPTHLRAPSAEKVLLGEKPSEALFALAGDAATRDCRPILDFRGSAEYRRAMVGVLTQRTLSVAHREILERC
jgi:CO/xanthine dehydrogenase FAD-binding subunit